MEQKSKTPPRVPYVPPHLRNKTTDAEKAKLENDDSRETTPKKNSSTPVKNEEKTTPIKSNQSTLDSTTSPANKVTPSPNTTPTRVAVALPPVASLTPEKTPTPSPAKSETATPKSASIQSPKTPSREWGYDESLEESFDKLKIKEETTPRRSPKTTTTTTPRTPESPSYRPLPIDEHIPKDVMHSLSYAVEISNIPSDMNTEDIDGWLETAQDPESYELKWVNESYCLAIFPSINIARQVLKTLTHPDFILKEFRHSSEDSKRFMLKREKLDYLLPPAEPRPARTAVVARRLIAGALQKPEIQRTPEHKAQERELRKQREDKRRQQSEERDTEKM